jgi:membrane carboxypeptidase/penicillin-binding protein
MFPIYINKRRRQQRLRQTGFRLIGITGLGCSVIISLVFVVSALVLAFIYQELTRDLPGTETLSAFFSVRQGKPFEPARLYDRNGTQIILTLENPAVNGNRYLKVSQTAGAREGVFSSSLISATVAIIEPGFWNGSGFSTSGLQGGEHPTIAQRLVDDLILWNEPAGLRRNIRERLLAAQVTSKYGHEQ